MNYSHFRPSTLLRIASFTLALLATAWCLTSGSTAQDASAPANNEQAAQPGETAPAGDQAAPVTPATEATETNASDETETEGDVSEDSTTATEVDANSSSPMADLLSAFLTTPPFGWLIQGGLFMWPILLMGILATGVTIERFRSLKMLSTDSTEVRRQVKGLLAEDRIEEAMLLCENEQGPVPAVLFAGLRKYYLLRRLDYDPANIQQQVIKAMEDYSVHIVAALEKHLPILATISGVASMLGFLGTVQGMIVAFDEIQAGLGSANIIDLAAGGIKVSLMTTCFGLIVGIPAFVAFNYFTGVVNRFVLEVEETSADLIETVTLQMATESAPQPSHAGSPT